LSEVAECPRCPMIPGSSVRLSECPSSEASTSECPRNRGHGLYSTSPPRPPHPGPRPPGPTGFLRAGVGACEYVVDVRRRTEMAADPPPHVDPGIIGHLGHSDSSDNTDPRDLPSPRASDISDSRALRTSEAFPRRQTLTITRASRHQPYKARLPGLPRCSLRSRRGGPSAGHRFPLRGAPNLLSDCPRRVGHCPSRPPPAPPAVSEVSEVSELETAPTSDNPPRTPFGHHLLDCPMSEGVRGRFGLIQVSVRPKLLLRLLQYRGKPGPPTWSTPSVGHTGAMIGLPARALTGSASLGPGREALGVPPQTVPGRRRGAESRWATTGCVPDLVRSVNPRLMVHRTSCAGTTGPPSMRG